MSQCDAAVQPPTGGEELTLLHMSDTHNLVFPEVAAALPPADILLHTGDFSCQGTELEYAEFDGFLHAVADKFPARVVVFGNHDLYSTFGHHRGPMDPSLDFSTPELHRSHMEPLRARLRHATHVPIAEEVTIQGLRIHGAPWWCGRCCSDGSRRTGAVGDECFDAIAPGCDILMTHGPPQGILDLADYRQDFHWGGVPGIKTSLQKCNIGMHLFGHVHESNGVAKCGNTLCINGGMTNWPWDNDERGTRLEFPARLIRAHRASSDQPWQFAVVRELTFTDESLRGKMKYGEKWWQDTDKQQSMFPGSPAHP